MTPAGEDVGDSCSSPKLVQVSDFANPQIAQINTDKDFNTCKMRDERTFKIIGAAMEVHRELDCGFLEAVYQEALEREFMEQGIPFKAQPAIEIVYKGRQAACKEI